jgi:hypothetical protein
MALVSLANSMGTLLETAQMDNLILDNLGTPEEEAIRGEERSFLEKRKIEFKINLL